MGAEGTADSRRRKQNNPHKTNPRDANLREQQEQRTDQIEKEEGKTTQEENRTTMREQQ